MNKFKEGLKVEATKEDILKEKIDIAIIQAISDVKPETKEDMTEKLTYLVNINLILTNFRELDQLFQKYFNRKDRFSLSGENKGDKKPKKKSEFFEKIHTAIINAIMNVKVEERQEVLQKTEYMMNINRVLEDIDELESIIKPFLTAKYKENKWANKPIEEKSRDDD